jgi:hypothetical protein
MTKQGECLYNYGLISKRAQNPIQWKMIYGLKKSEEGGIKFNLRFSPKLVEIMEAQNVKVTFFFDQE